MVEVVFIDTSVFVAALKSPDGAREIIRLCLQGKLLPLMGHKIFLEFEDVLRRPKLFESCPLTEEEREVLFSGFLSVCRWVNIFFLWRPNLPDEGDNHVIELAVAGGATTIITHNVSDFVGELKLGVGIMTPAQFLQTKR